MGRRAGGRAACVRGGRQAGRQVWPGSGVVKVANPRGHLGPPEEGVERREWGPAERTGCLSDGVLLVAGVLGSESEALFTRHPSGGEPNAEGFRHLRSRLVCRGPRECSGSGSGREEGKHSPREAGEERRAAKFGWERRVNWWAGACVRQARGQERRGVRARHWAPSARVQGRSGGSGRTRLAMGRGRGPPRSRVPVGRAKRWACQEWDSNPRLQGRLRPERSALDRSAILTAGLGASPLAWLGPRANAGGGRRLCGRARDGTRAPADQEPRQPTGLAPAPAPPSPLAHPRPRTQRPASGQPVSPPWAPPPPPPPPLGRRRPPSSAPAHPGRPSPCSQPCLPARASSPCAIRARQALGAGALGVFRAVRIPAPGPGPESTASRDGRAARRADALGLGSGRAGCGTWRAPV